MMSKFMSFDSSKAVHSWVMKQNPIHPIIRLYSQHYSLSLRGQLEDFFTTRICQMLLRFDEV